MNPDRGSSLCQVNHRASNEGCVVLHHNDEERIVVSVRPSLGAALDEACDLSGERGDPTSRLSERLEAERMTLRGHVGEPLEPVPAHRSRWRDHRGDTEVRRRVERSQLGHQPRHHALTHRLGTTDAKCPTLDEVTRDWDMVDGGKGLDGALQLLSKLPRGLRDPLPLDHSSARLPTDAETEVSEGVMLSPPRPEQRGERFDGGDRLSHRGVLHQANLALCIL